MGRLVTEVSLRRKGVLFIQHPDGMRIRGAKSLASEITAAITERIPLVGTPGTSLPAPHSKLGVCSTCGDEYQLPQESGRGGTCCLCIAARQKITREARNAT